MITVECATCRAAFECVDRGPEQTAKLCNRCWANEIAEQIRKKLDGRKIETLQLGSRPNPLRIYNRVRP